MNVIGMALTILLMLPKLTLYRDVKVTKVGFHTLAILMRN